MPEGQMHLNLFIQGSGHHEAAWRLPGSPPQATMDFEHYRNATEIAERAKLDSIFLADILSTGQDIRRNLIPGLEPLTILAGLSIATERIGLIATASTSYNEPFNLARRFASLDHLSGGRIGWNIVTSATEAEARNFGLEVRIAHANRYQRAAEFVDVVSGLWDSWEDGALVEDRSSGLSVDADRLHALDHDGEHFKVAGPLNIPRSPQGRPVFVQAGSSKDGKEFAGTFAEAVFTAQRTIDEGCAFRTELRDYALRQGRDPGQIKVLPGISPTVGSTEEEAHQIEEELVTLTQVEYGLKQLSFFLEQEITVDQLDEPLPPLATVDTIDGQKGRFKLLVDLARDEDLTVRQLIGRMAGGRGHRTIVGTPEQVAADLELWFASGAADGFNLMPPTIPGQLEVFVEGVVPILQEKGIFRRDYEGVTLRDHYGLLYP
jgi:FMN-dependent oxidoreductase (nitrilotriacetate monooxygenase family)